MKSSLGISNFLEEISISIETEENNRMGKTVKYKLFKTWD